MKRYTSHGDSRTEDQIEADSIKEMFPNFKEVFIFNYIVHK